MSALESLTIGKLFPLILTRMYEVEVPLPFDDRIWQRVFYRFGKIDSIKATNKIEKLFWDSDGPEPKCQSLRRVLDNFRVIGIIRRSCGVGPDSFDEGMVELWKKEHKLLFEKYKTELGELLVIVKEEIARATP